MHARVQRIARVGSPSHSAGASFVDFSATPAACFDVPVRAESKAARSAIVTRRGRRGPSRRRCLRAACGVIRGVAQGGARSNSLPQEVNARLRPRGPVHGTGVGRARSVAVLRYVCTLGPATIGSAWRIRTITDIAVANGAAPLVVRLRIASWADGMAAAAARPGLGGTEPASTGGTRNFKAIPCVDAGLSLLGAGEDNAHVGILEFGGVRPAPDGSHCESRVAEQGSFPIVVVTAPANRRAVGVNVDVGTVTGGVGADVGDNRAFPNASPGRAAWARGRGRVGKQGEGAVMNGLGLAVPRIRWCGLVEGSAVTKNVKVVHEVVASGLRVRVVVIVTGAVVVRSVIVLGQVKWWALAGAGGGGNNRVSGARCATSLVLEDDAVRAVP